MHIFAFVLLIHRKKLIHYKSIPNEKKDTPWIIFVHGAGGSSTIWYKQVKPFSKNFNVLLIDLRGHGLSKLSHLENSYSLDQISDDILEVMDYLKIEKAHFIGISLGTIIIRLIGEKHPEKTISLVMGGAVMEMNLRCQFLMYIAKISRSIIPYMYLYKFFAYIIMPKSNNKKSRLLFVNEAKRLCQNEFKKWVILFTKLKPILNTFQVAPSKIKTLYIMGDEDYMFLPFISESYAKHPNSSLVVLPNCGHVVNIDQSTLFNEHVLAFIQ